MLNTIYYILYTICNIPCNYIITQAPSKSPHSYSPRAGMEDAIHDFFDAPGQRTVSNQAVKD